MSCCNFNRGNHHRPIFPESKAEAAAMAVTKAMGWFSSMVSNNLQNARAAKASGKPIIGMMCEFAPREIIMAAGGYPVCLCGGSADTIPMAETILPNSVCPLIKSTFGYHLEKSNPFLEMADLVVAETTCDGKKKMFELMSHSRETWLLELPQKEDDQDAFEHWKRELQKFRDFLEYRFDVIISDDKLRESIILMNYERKLRRELAELMKLKHPPLSGRQLLELKALISCLPDDLLEYENLLNSLKAAAHTLNFEEKTEVHSSYYVPVRVLLTGVPLVHGTERLMEIIETHGGIVVAQENCTGLKPIIEDVDENSPDLMTAIAVKYFHIGCSIRTPNQRRFTLLRKLISEFYPECVVELVWQGCLTYEIESWKVRQLVEKEFGLPYIKIQTDYSEGDTQRIILRLEALFENIRNMRNVIKEKNPIG